MGYRDDVYNLGNIIGYTGDDPATRTVYVYDAGTKEFGRLTQAHAHQDNVGRNKVRKEDDYWIGNEGGRGVEKYRGQIRHRSRNAFVPVTEAIALELHLHQVINRVQNLKAKHAEHNTDLDDD